MAELIQPVSGVIGEVMITMDIPEKERKNLLVYSLWFLRHYKSFIDVQPVTLYLDSVPLNKVVSLPLSFMDFIRIGYVDRNNKIIERSERKTMNHIAPITDAPEVPQSNNDTWAGGNYIGSNASGLANNGFGRGPIRSARPAEIYGAFYINREAGVIQLDANVDWPNFYMDYKSDCIQLSDETLIHPFSQNALVAFLQYRYSKDRRRDGSYEANWLLEERRMRRAMHPVDLQLVMDSLDAYRGYTK
jgi:hypothetical protein